jgi:hypothetical protein
MAVESEIAQTLDLQPKPFHYVHIFHPYLRLPEAESQREKGY